MKVGVLTSSRADYGIYQPLLQALGDDKDVELCLLVFGMHLLPEYGNTYKLVEDDNHSNIIKVWGMIAEDSHCEITRSYGQIITNFASVWEKGGFDLIFALGDRYEMSAAVQSTIPFNLRVAHIHGGETTLGAIDNIYRHQISLASALHFTATDQFAKRVQQIVDSKENVYNVGALSLDGFEKLKLPDWSKVAAKFLIPIGNFILVTVHPETANSSLNAAFADELRSALMILCAKINIVITLTNADSGGSVFRKMAKDLKIDFPNSVFLVDNFGRLNYFAAMKSCNYMLGNTSSGIIEAASFKKYVINIGDRQLGRLRSSNVIDVRFSKEQILEAVDEVNEKGEYLGDNLYYKTDTAKRIIELIKTYANI